MGETMTTVSENMAAGRHGAGAVTESLHVIHKHRFWGGEGEGYLQTDRTRLTDSQRL